MYRFDDAFNQYAFCRHFARAPDDAVTGDQRADGATDIATVHAAVFGFYIGVHTKAADHPAFSGIAEQVVVVVRFLRSGLKTALMIGVNPALLPLGEFIFTQSCWLLVARNGQNLYDTH
jgi:hypothetical protein